MPKVRPIIRPMRRKTARFRFSLNGTVGASGGVFCGFSDIETSGFGGKGFWFLMFGFWIGSQPKTKH